VHGLLEGRVVVAEGRLDVALADEALAAESMDTLALAADAVVMMPIAPRAARPAILVMRCTSSSY
jgi:hypothetical protein